MNLIVDLVNEPAKGASPVAQSMSGTLNGAAIDMNDGHVLTNGLVVAGAFTNVTDFTVELQESATSTGTFTTISGSTTKITAGSSLTAIKGLRSKQFCRIAVTAFNGSGSAPVAGAIIAQSKIAPQSGGYDRSPSA